MKEQFLLIWSVFVMWIDKNVDFDMLFIDDARLFLMFFLLVHNWLSVIFLHFHIQFLIFWFLLHMFFRSSLFLPARWLRQRKFQLFFLPLSFMNFRLRFLCLPVCVHLHSHSKAVKILGIFFSLHVLTETHQLTRSLSISMTLHFPYVVKRFYSAVRILQST